MSFTVFAFSEVDAHEALMLHGHKPQPPTLAEVPRDPNHQSTIIGALPRNKDNKCLHFSG